MRTSFLIIASLLLLASCGGLKINAPGPSSQTLLIIPTELDAQVVSIRHSFYYIYEITKADDSSFSYEIEIKYPVEGDMVIVDSLPPGDYIVRQFKFLPLGGDTTYGTNTRPRSDRFSLEAGKITIFSKSFKLILRNQDPGRFAVIIYNFEINPVTDEQEQAIQATLKQLPNFDQWKM